MDDSYIFQYKSPRGCAGFSDDALLSLILLFRLAEFLDAHLEVLEELFGEGGEVMIGGVDVADVHHFGRFQRDWHDFFTVRVSIQSAGCDVVAEDVAHELEHGGFIGDHDALLGFFGGVQFFCEMEGVVQALFIGETREGLEFFQRDGLSVGQWMVFAQEDVGLGLEEGNEIELCILENTLEHVPIEFREVEDAELTSLGAHIFDDVVGTGFAEREFVLFFFVVMDERSECIHRKGIVLGGYGKYTADWRTEFVLVFQHIGLFYDLAGVGEKFRAIVGEVDPAVIPVKYGDPHFFFQISNGFGKARLCDVELLGGHADGSRLDDL